MAGGSKRKNMSKEKAKRFYLEGDRAQQAGINYSPYTPGSAECALWKRGHHDSWFSEMITEDAL